MSYVPDRGDVVRLTFDPQSGHEQAGRRPAVVVSPRTYNERVGLALLCPVTRQIKGYPFEVVIPEALGVEGVVLVDQLRSFDWRARRAEFICKLPLPTMTEVIQKLGTLIN